MSRRSDRPSADYNEIAPSLGLLDPDDRWYPEPSDTSSLGIRREQIPKPRDGSWSEDDPAPAIVLTPAQAARLALLEYAAAAWWDGSRPLVRKRRHRPAIAG
jgi:hypothetical protein